MQYTYKNKIFGDVDDITEVVCEILRHISSRTSENICFDIRLILNELLINCHKHGNKKSREKAIDLYFNINPKEIKIVVKDEGKGILIKEPCKEDLMKSDGRGLKLVKALTDKMEIKNNKVTCVIYITK
ncbi:MAG: ATP-binding protein [Helcococcus sp.]|nr:ATP-binding protein [Helcococcus sp.]